MVHSIIRKVNYQSCSFSRHYFLKSRSRKSKVLENGHVSTVSFSSPMELFQHLNMPKESYFKAAFFTIIDFKTNNGSKVTMTF